MRLAQVGLGSGVGLSGLAYIGTILVRSASKIFLNQKRQTTTATCDPPERSLKPLK